MVVQLSAYGQGHKAIKELAGNELAPINSNRSVIQIAVEYGRKRTDGMNLGSTVSDAIDRDYALQKRDPLTAIIGVSGAGGVAYMVANNLGNLETFLSRVWKHVLKKCFKQGEKLKNGGCLSLDGKSITWKGEILEFVHESVHVFVISPKDCYQTIVIAGKRVFHNRELIVQNTDITDELLATTMYRVCADGSHWYTNLPVGEPMTKDKIDEFRKLQWHVEQERDRTTRGVLAAAKRKAVKAAKSVDEQRKRVMLVAKGSFNKGSQSDGSSRGRSNVSDEYGSRTPPIDEGYDSGYDSVLSHLEDGSAFDRGGSAAGRDSMGATLSESGSFSGRTSREEEMQRPSSALAKVASAARLLGLYIRKAGRLGSSSGDPRLGTPNRLRSGEGSELRAETSGRRPGSGCGLFRSRSLPRINAENQASAGSP